MYKKILTILLIITLTNSEIFTAHERHFKSDPQHKDTIIRGISEDILLKLHIKLDENTKTFIL